jgi:hypothetical protein
VDEGYGYGRIDILVHGCRHDAGYEPYLLRVPSKLLTYISPVFDVMLNGPFSEGLARLNTANPHTLKLTEDDPVAMLSLCLHMHQKGSSRLPVTYQLKFYYAPLKLVLLGDKHQRTDVIKIWFCSWTLEQDIQTAFSAARIGSIIQMAYMLDDCEVFCWFTNFVIRHLDFFPKEKAFKQALGDHVSTATFAVLKREQQACLTRLSNEFAETCMELPMPPQMPDNLFELSSKFVQAVFRHKLWDSLTLGGGVTPLQEALEVLMSIALK